MGGWAAVIGVGSLEEDTGDPAGGMEHSGDPEMSWGEAGLAQPTCTGGAAVHGMAGTSCLWKVLP